MSPVLELRGGLPFAIAKGMHPGLAFLLCIGANLLVFPIVFWFLEHIHYRFLHVGTYRHAFDKYMERVRKKAKPLVEKYGMLGLIVLVAIPFPGTGVYTGTLAAWFFGMKGWRPFFSIALGLLVAGVLVLAASIGGMSLLT
jgi:uncharacterized membrane protein